MSKLPDLIIVEKCEKRKMRLKFIFIAGTTVVNAGGFNAISLSPELLCKDCLFATVASCI
jgi:hypothetical protein